MSYTDRSEESNDFHDEFVETVDESAPEESASFRAEAKDDASARPVELDAQSLLSADLSRSVLLTRPEEEALTRRIAQARKRVRAVLRRTRKLARAALADEGRGVIGPDQDFREREAVTILNFAREVAKNTKRLRALGLTRSDTRAFIKELTQALESYRLLRDDMVRANVRLVNALARRYHHPTLTALDLFQEGTIGLIRAIEKYDPERNIKFSTYATWWIWQQLGRAADTYGSLIRTPVHWNQFRRRLGRDQQEMGADADKALTREEMANSQGIDPQRFEAMSQAFYFMSTSAPLGEDDDRSLESVLADEESQPEDTVVKASLRERLEQALTSLPPREGYILRQRFGWIDDKSETLDEIGVRLGVSRERIRQLETRALKHLKAFCADQGLRTFLQ